jgi:DNA helicase-2/ATP-dependent DNA helicase PcrA
VEEGELPFKRSQSEQGVDEERRVFYVGITRAKTHLAITWVNDGRRKGSRFVAELRADEKVKTLTRKEANTDTIPAREGLELELQGGFEGPIVAINEDGVLVDIQGGSSLSVDFGATVTAEGKTLPLGPPDPADDPLFKALKEWRLDRSKKDEVPAYVIFHDSTLESIAQTRPQSVEDLAEIPGIGPTKLERYGDEILSLITG